MSKGDHTESSRTELVDDVVVDDDVTSSSALDFIEKIKGEEKGKRQREPGRPRGEGEEVLGARPYRNGNG